MYFRDHVMYFRGQVTICKDAPYGYWLGNRHPIIYRQRVMLKSAKITKNFMKILYVNMCYIWYIFKLCHSSDSAVIAEDGN